MRISKLLDVKTPERGTSLSAGIDFFIPNNYFKDFGFMIQPGENVVINSGIMIDMESLRNEVMYAMFGKDLFNVLSRDRIGVDLLGVDKSGIASKEGLMIGAKLIDQDYQGVLHIDIHNVGRKSVLLKNGMKIAQFKPELTFYPSIEVVDKDELFKTITERGEGRFGSTNK